jgi:hypothetical protein
VRRSNYLDQDVCVHIDSALMRSLSGYLLFGHNATDPFNNGTLPSTNSGTGWHFLPECHYYSPLTITHPSLVPKFPNNTSTYPRTLNPPFYHLYQTP